MPSLEEQKIRKLLGRRIKELRNRAGLTQEELGAIIHKDTAYVGHVEQGIKTPSLSYLIKVAGRLNIEIWELFKF